MSCAIAAWAYVEAVSTMSVSVAGVLAQDSVTLRPARKRVGHAVLGNSPDRARSDLPEQPATRSAALCVRS